MKLDAYLAQMGLTDAAFADRVGTDRTTISRLRRGKQGKSFALLERIAAATNGLVTPNDFLSAATLKSEAAE